jgi:hypothetical protein
MKKGKYSSIAFVVLVFSLISLIAGCGESSPKQTLSTPTVAFKVVSLQVEPNSAILGEKIVVTVDVKNDGNTKGIYSLPLTIDGIVEQTKDVILEGGKMKSVSFTIYEDSVGSHNIQIGDLKSVFEVTQAVRLATGTFLIQRLSGGMGELTVENGTDLDAVAILSRPEQLSFPLLAVYIKAKDSYTVKGIGDGIYLLYYMLGEDWDDTSKAFTMNSSFSRFEDELHFATTANAYEVYEATLHPVVGGTAQTESVDRNEFPKLY